VAFELRTLIIANKTNQEMLPGTGSQTSRHGEPNAPQPVVPDDTKFPVMGFFDTLQ
jgi:hypothetical protein